MEVINVVNTVRSILKWAERAALDKILDVIPLEDVLQSCSNTWLQKGSSLA